MADLSETPAVGGRPQDQRRSQRVTLVVPLELAWTTPEHVRMQEHAETVTVNAQGALLRTKTPLPPTGEVKLTRPRMHQSARARIVRVEQPDTEGWLRIAVELLLPGEAFWGISIPPIPRHAAA